MSDPVEQLMQRIVEESQGSESVGAAITKVMVEGITKHMILLYAAPAGIVASHKDIDHESSLELTIKRVVQAMKDGLNAVPAKYKNDGALLMTHAIRCAAFDLIKACDEAIECGH